MTVFEEYDTAAEKRKAQQRAKRGKPTGKARGFVFVFEENGWTTRGTRDARGSVFHLEPGEGPRGELASVGPSMDYLRQNCRRVGGRHLPPEWRKIWDNLRKPD